MSETKITGLYKKGTSDFEPFIPFGLTGDNVSMHSGINLERELKIGSLKDTFIIKDPVAEQVKIYEIYFDGLANEDKNYLVETIIGEEAFLNYIVTEDDNIISTVDGKNLILFKKNKSSTVDNRIAVVKLYLAATGENASDFSSNDVQYICNLDNTKYYGILLKEKWIKKVSSENYITIQEEYV